MWGNSALMSGHMQKALSCIKVGFMSQTTLNSIMTWCMCPWSCCCRTSWMMEDIGTGVTELLVARAVQVCCQVCHGMQCMQLDKDLPYAEGGEANPQQSP